MNILVISGSPHKNGTSSLLVDNFIQGAQNEKNKIVRFDAAFFDIKPCFGCNYCRNHEGQCVQKDDMERIKQTIIDSDAVVFASPVYYFAMSAQIKLVIDRFYAMNSLIMKSHKKAALLATCADSEDWVIEPLYMHYKAMCKYLNMEDKGAVLAKGVAERKDIEFTSYPRLAYDLGCTFK